jgi:predicted RNA-binding protein associated with RNAse of E/G family
VQRTLGRGQLRITHAGDPFSVFLFTHADSSFRGWYVNIEQPQQRSTAGFDYEDELLDVWVELGAEPELLDEDELEEAVERGFMSAERAAAVRTTAAQVIAEPPWPTGWEDWRPEPGWQMPVLPPGWETT